MSTTPNRRRVACAAALPAFPVALLAGSLVSPTDSTDNATQLAAAAAHGTPWVAAALLELLAAALMPLAVAGVVAAVRARGAGLATAAGLVGVLGSLGMTLISARHLFVYGMAGIDRAAALHALDRVDHAAGLVVLPLMFAGPVTFVLLASAAARARLVSRWLVVGALVFFVSDSLPIPAAEEIQMLVGIATLGTLALRSLRAPGAAPAAAAAAAA